MLITIAAFFAPVAAGFLVPRSVSMPGVWLTAALIEAPVCMALRQPYAMVAAVLSMILAAMAVGATRPYPPQRKIRRREEREVRAFLEEIDGADTDLVARVWEAPRPRIRERDDSA